MSKIPNPFSKFRESNNTSNPIFSNQSTPVVSNLQTSNSDVPTNPIDEKTTPVDSDVQVTVPKVSIRPKIEHKKPNVSIRPEIEKEVRSAFKPRPGNWMEETKEKEKKEKILSEFENKGAKQIELSEIDEKDVNKIYLVVGDNYWDNWGISYLYNVYTKDTKSKKLHFWAGYEREMERILHVYPTSSSYDALVFTNVAYPENDNRAYPAEYIYNQDILYDGDRKTYTTRDTAEDFLGKIYELPEDIQNEYRPPTTTGGRKSRKSKKTRKARKNRKARKSRKHTKRV